MAGLTVGRVEVYRPDLAPRCALGDETGEGGGVEFGDTGVDDVLYGEEEEEGEKRIREEEKEENGEKLKENAQTSTKSIKSCSC